MLSNQPATQVSCITHPKLKLHQLPFDCLNIIFNHLDLQKLANVITKLSKENLEIVRRFAMQNKRKLRVTLYKNLDFDKVDET